MCPDDAPCNWSSGKGKGGVEGGGMGGGGGLLMILDALRHVSIGLGGERAILWANCRTVEYGVSSRAQYTMSP